MCTQKVKNNLKRVCIGKTKRTTQSIGAKKSKERSLNTRVEQERIEKLNELEIV